MVTQDERFELTEESVEEVVVPRSDLEPEFSYCYDSVDMYIDFLGWDSDLNIPLKIVTKTIVYENET